LDSLAYEQLYRAGYRNIHVLNEGLPGWQQRHYPVEGQQRQSQRHD
jgi:3-mercaptopyruvate sulfurtransferase SseA